MRKSTLVTLIALAVLGAGTWVFLTNPFSPDASLIQKVSLKFMEDLQFKDFRSSSLYHHKLERDRVDIGKTLETLFMIKPEFLDLMDYRISKVDIDESGERARVLVTTKFKRLNMKSKPEEGELILYWMKRHPDCPIGATCQVGRCVDEFGKGSIRTPTEAEIAEARRKDKPDPQPEPMMCDSNAQPAWFMNLDSTLKEKKYNY
ncbi:MAG: hypothetical protein R3E66_14295 [bacterium]